MRTRFVPPNAIYWFGTDEYGRDVLSRLLMGTRLSLTMGVSATLVSLAIGVPMGLAAGYFRGWIDEALMRLADVLHGRSADHDRSARARGHASCPLEDGARGRLCLYSANRAGWHAASR